MRKPKYTLILIAIVILFVAYKHSCSTSNEKTAVKEQDLTSTNITTRERAVHAKASRKAPELEVGNDKSPYQTIRDQYPYGHEMHDIFDKNPHLATFLDFKNRPLLDPAARAEYERFLSNEEVIRSARAGLLDSGDPDYSLAESITREMNADFFETAMKWKNNPLREQLIDTIKEIVLNDNFNEGQSEFAQKSLAQSKINLFRILYETNAEHARTMAARAHGTRMESLITYALGQQGHTSAN